MQESMMRLIKVFVIMVCWLVVCSLASAQNAPRGEVKFPWKPGETPTQFWIGRTSERCVSVQGQGGVWLARTVLSTAKPGAAGEWLCSFSWNGPNSPPDLTTLRRITGGRLEVDPPVVRPNFGADPERDVSWFEPLYTLTRTRLGMPSKREPHKLTQVVRVAILDTAADTPSGFVDPVGHGRAIGRLVHELACGELEKCATQISQLPALPFASQPDQTLSLQPQGTGAIGTRAILAAAIEQASSTWQNSAKRLVINLSVGWSGCWERDPRTWPRFDQLVSAKRDMASQAVLTAIGRAACRGALVVAAAGNGDAQKGCPSKPASPGEPRHMFPGLWGGTRLDPSVCSSLGVNATFDEPRPLLVGVGGVDDTDQQLAITDHEADVVAYAQGVTVPDTAQPTGWTLPLSGTSMSAAALTGIAAALWSYQPELSVPQLLAVIRGSAVPLRPAPAAVDPGARDFVCNETFSGGACPEIARVSLCAALGKYAGECSTPEAAKESSASFATMSPLADALVAVDCDACADACPAECEKDEELNALTGPWVVPQPKPDGCGICVFVPTLRLFQAEFLYGVGSPVLYVNRPGQSEASRYALLTPLVLPFVPTTWLLPPGAAAGTSAWLVYRASSSMAKESGDVLLQSVPPFTVGSILGGP
jgi:Pyruvate/2-oxoacid:ferredoxin oxidoreductase delta subunit